MSKLSKQCINKEKKLGSEYFSLALYAFGGLGLEMLYAYLIEPAIYGHGISDFTPMQSVLHWTITCITWGIVAFLLIRHAKRELGFTLNALGQKTRLWQWLTSVLLILVMTLINICDIGELKIYHEFKKMEPLEFTFQHIYYLVETILFTLIIVFGQIAMEKWLKRTDIPFGGILVGLTWGLAHWFTKGSLMIGLEGIFVGFLFGTAYLFLNRDLKKTYLVLALAFIL
ncbi:MAG: hypothetical protein K2J90_04390 [Lachnospiraceae bacterium]|nr:hypothetical protein [Lachnospiraceae bacterium]